MKIFRDYDGVLPRIVHAPAEYALRGAHAVISAACRAEKDEVPDELVLTLHSAGEQKIPMAPSDHFEGEEQTWEIYRAEIPASFVWGESMRYTISAAGCCPTEQFTVPLVDSARLPALPPLAISELFIRPKTPVSTAYIEFYNPSDADTDLYDYEVLVFPKMTEAEGEPAGRLPLALEAGTQILRPGEFAAVWPLRPANWGAEIGGVKADYLTQEDFFRIFGREFFYKSYSEFVPEESRIIPVDYTRVDETTGKRKTIPGVCDIPEKHNPSVLVIVPRGMDKESAVYTLVYSTEYAHWDTPVKRASQWTIDPRDPYHGVNIAHAELATPGFAGRGQAKPDLSAALPAVVPLSPDRDIYLGDGACRVSFAAIPADDETPVSDAKVILSLPGGGEQVLVAVNDGTGAYSAEIPAAVIERLDTLTYRISVTDGTRSVTSAPVEVCVIDNAGPHITGMIPSKKYAYDGNAENTPVRAEYYDISGVNTPACRLSVDGKDVTEKAVFRQDGMEYLPAKKFEVGEHRLELTLVDTNGNKTEKNIFFSVSDMAELNVYRGEVHCHTSESDGTGMAADAYEYARDVGGVDYFAVTEHSHYLAPEYYAHQVEVANRFNDPGHFAAIYGWEMTWNNTCGYWGHMNFLNSREIVNNIQKNDMPAMFGWLRDHPEAVAMFNHPMWTWGDFDEFGHKTALADEKVALAEIKGAFFDREYALMLSKGWHAAPVSNEDNHAPNWTTASPQTGCVLAPSLTRQNILDAFLARRTYTTGDATMKIFYRVNGAWLGSHLDDPEELDFDIRITTENEQGIGLVEIVAEDNITVAVRDASGCRSLEWSPILPAEFDYYYLRITREKCYTSTAAVWLDRPTCSVELDFAASEDKALPMSVTATVKNTTEDAITDVRVNYYISPISGFRYGDKEPFAAAYPGRIGAGKEKKLTRDIPDVPGLRRLTAVVTAKQGSRNVTATAYILLSHLTVTEVTPSTGEYIAADGTKLANPFSYVTIFNSSVNDIPLDGGRLTLWTVTGKQPLPANIMPTDGITVPARSTVVIWHRPKKCAALTAADFNARYGKTLEGGRTCSSRRSRSPPTARTAEGSTCGSEMI